MAVEEVNKEVLEYLSELFMLRVAGHGKRLKGTDGQVTYEDEDLFTPEQVKGYLQLSLSAFNVVCGTYYGLGDVEFCKYFASLLVSYAASIALAGQALLERGREFSTTDNGISFVPPDIAAMAWNQASMEREWWYQQMHEVLEAQSEWLKSPE
jgi:hypothetical protein